MLKYLSILVVLAVLTGTASADFALLAVEGDAAPSRTVLPEGTHSSSAKTAAKAKPATTASAHRRGAIAQGFGSGVPLAFAIRQMVPDGVAVALDPSADADALVDWRGGRPWAEALAEAVRPIGLAVAVHARSVEIYPRTKP